MLKAGCMVAFPCYRERLQAWCLAQQLAAKDTVWPECSPPAAASCQLPLLGAPAAQLQALIWRLPPRSPSPTERRQPYGMCWQCIWGGFPGQNVPGIAKPRSAPMFDRQSPADAAVTLGNRCQQPKTSPTHQRCHAQPGAHHACLPCHPARVRPVSEVGVLPTSGACLLRACGQSDLHQRAQERSCC